MKVQARNNLLKKLSGTQWGARPHTMSTTRLAFYFSAGEYACPVWSRSKHVKHVHVALNDNGRAVRSCLRSTPINKIYCLSGIAPPRIRRSETTDLERIKPLKDDRHPMFQYETVRTRLKSRQSFITSSMELKDPLDQARLLRQRAEAEIDDPIQPNQHLPPGKDLRWNLWKTIYRFRTGVARRDQTW